MTATVTQGFLLLRSAAAQHQSRAPSIRRRNLLVTASWTIIALTAASQLTVAQPQAQSCNTGRSYLSAAQKAIAGGDSTTALDQLNRAVQVDPQCADAYLLLGLTEFHGGQISDSVQHYKQALKLTPRSYSGHYDLALAYLKQNNLRDARVELERAVALDPKQTNAVYDLGIVLLQMKQPAAALPHLRRAHAMNPDRADVSFNIVRAELEAGSVAAARKSAQDDASHLASDFQWNAAIGQLFLKHAQPQDAAAYFRAANFIHPEDEDLRNQLADAYLASRQPDRALELIKDPKTAEEHYIRGSAFYQVHRFTEADQESEVALTLAPENAKVLVLRARLLQRASEQNAAVQVALRAAKLAPDWDEPFYLAGVSYYFNRQYPQARQNLMRAFELNPASAATIFVEGLASANEGNPEEAKKDIQQAIVLQPDNARFYCHMGILFLRENQYGEAEQFLRKSIELKPEYALPHYELGKLRMQSKHWNEAAAELDKAIALDPGLTSAYYQLALVYGKLGEKDKAEHTLNEFKKLHQQELDESEAVDGDARQESDSH